MAKIDDSTEIIKKPAQAKPEQELSEDELARVVGGLANNPGNPPVSDAIVSPRDPASGLPTGKRMHKPYSISG